MVSVLLYVSTREREARVVGGYKGGLMGVTEEIRQRGRYTVGIGVREKADRAGNEELRRPRSSASWLGEPETRSH